MFNVVISVLTMGILGAFFAFGLSIARKKFKVEEDPRIDRVEEALPGANCGACGYPGCRAMAEAIVQGQAEPDGCPVGGAETAREVAEIMGIEVKESERRVAVLLCRGTEEVAKRKAEYRGVAECFAASLVQSGDKFCSYGCLGYGDCVEACNFDALHMGADGLPIVDREKCTACGLCVKACPKNLLELHLVSRKLFVFCKSLDNPKNSRKNCKNACTGCMICTKGAQHGEIVVEDSLSRIKNLAVLDDPGAMEWVGKCPTQAIGFLNTSKN
jgi:electron transport complex protein RnfB